jgi:hypothetical protein
VIAHDLCCWYMIPETGLSFSFISFCCCFWNVPYLNIFTVWKVLWEHTIFLSNHLCVLSARLSISFVVQYWCPFSCGFVPCSSDRKFFVVYKIYKREFFMRGTYKFINVKIYAYTWRVVKAEQSHILLAKNENYMMLLTLIFLSFEGWKFWTTKMALSNKNFKY